MAKIQEFFGKQYLVSDYNLIQWNGNDPVAHAVVPKALTAQEIDYIVCGAIEGGINYWARLDRARIPHWDEKPANITGSDWCSMLLLNGYWIQFYDCEEPYPETPSDEWKLTMDKLVKGFEQNCKERPWDCDLDNADASTYDCIIQYALFGKLVYG